MFGTILGFELRYLLRRPSTWLFFVLLLLFGFFMIASEAMSLTGGGGQVKRNAPYVIALGMVLFTAVGQVITTGLMGTGVLRDFQLKAHELFFTTRLTRFGYVGGRFIGGLLVMLVIYAALPVGMLLGSLAPWLDHDHVLPIRLWHYWQPYLVIVVPNVLFVSALFFAVGTLTRKMFLVYVQGIVLLVIYSITQNLLRNLDNFRVASMVDGFGITTVQLMTRYWSVAQKNGSVVPLEGYLLTNRMIWIGVALALLLLTWLLFRFDVEPLGLRRPRRGKVAADKASGTPAAVTGVMARPDFASRTVWIQLWSSTRFTFRMILRDTAFRAIGAIGIINVVMNVWYADRFYDVPTWPVTAVVTEAILGGFQLFFYILAAVYAGELVWRERQLGADQTMDSLPVPDLVTLGGKLSGFLGAMIVLITVLAVAGMGVQTVKGYTHFEPALYVQQLYGLLLPSIFQVTVLAFVIHVLVNQKYVGHAAVLVFWVITLVLGAWGVDHSLFQYGSVPGVTYSDMNGYGPYVPRAVSLSGYGIALALVLFAVAYIYWVRGTISDTRDRLTLARGRWTHGTRLATGGAGLLAVGVGLFVFWNTNVLNHYARRKTRDKAQAAYERTYRGYLRFDQPRITDVKVTADMFPEQRRFAFRGTYALVNRHSRPLDTLYVSVLSAATWSNTRHTGYRFDSLVPDRSATPLVQDSLNGVYLFRLDQPLLPGDTLRLRFASSYRHAGFPDGPFQNAIAANGSFLNNGYLPTIGYDESGELTDDDRRKEQKLGPRDRTPKLEDEAARANQDFTRDADWIGFDATVGTSPDQIAIAPGYLEREWTENGRRYFHYRMDRPILNFYSFLSARYAVRKDRWNDVNLEVYYHPGHEYNLDRFLQASKDGLAYFSASFSPYQFRQYRILEFPRYASFAQSFPNTVPYSEGIGFISRVKDDADDLDMPYFVTAHELAHQWWGHQLVGANVQGAAILSEALAEYSALVLMERKYGREHSQKFLRYELDNYLRGRSGERKGEQPLLRAEGQAYIHYYKGSLVLYALRDYIGEDSLNSALRRFVGDKAYQMPPYTTSREFLGYLDRVTPDSLKPTLHDLFERITFWEHTAQTARAMRQADSSWKVTLTVRARKVYADSLGTESPAPLGDYVDVGVFGDPEKGSKLGRVLAVRKEKITAPEMTFEFTVKGEPRRAGIDPFNRLIDRFPEDNLTDVERP
jgi:ABC-2 type transport system permease protein